jgi:hypothetical protein
VLDEVFTNNFSSALEGLLGREVRDESYHILEARGIRDHEVPSRFDNVIEAPHKVFGEGARIIIQRVLRVPYEKYSLPANFFCQDSLLDRLTLLRDRIVMDHLVRGESRTWTFSRTKKQGHGIKTRHLITGNPLEGMSGHVF